MTFLLVLDYCTTSIINITITGTTYYYYMLYYYILLLIVYSSGTLQHPWVTTK